MLIDFSKKGREQERDGEKNIYLLPFKCVLTRGQIHNLGIINAWSGVEPVTFHFMEWYSDRLSHTGQSWLNWYFGGFLHCKVN